VLRSLIPLRECLARDTDPFQIADLLLQFMDACYPFRVELGKIPEIAAAFDRRNRTKPAHETNKFKRIMEDEARLRNIRSALVALEITGPKPSLNSVKEAVHAWLKENGISIGKSKILELLPLAF
jgi:hypothetical protein